jgi:hypothetical protein
MKNAIIVSKKHGVNPMIPRCFFCGAAKNEVALMGRLPGDAEAPHNAVIDNAPCDQCKVHMEQGIMLIGVVGNSDPNSGRRTGMMVVVKEEMIKRVINNAELLAQTLAQRMAFVPEDVWGTLGLPTEPTAPTPGFKKNPHAGQFDFRRAWNEVAKPAFDALPQNLRDLYERICVECKDLHQESGTLNMPWPGDDPIRWPYGSLRAVFDAVDAEWLAQAARVINCYGHWSPSGHVQAGGGGTWKFSNYADQILRERCGMNVVCAGKYKTSGITYQIHEGLLRVCYEDPHSWWWHEVGLGTPETYKRAQQFDSHLVKRDENFDIWATRMADEWWPTVGFMPKFRNIVKAFVEPEFVKDESP